MSYLLAPSQADALSAFIDAARASPTPAFTAAAIVLWTGVVTTAYPTWAQSFGQRSVPPSTAAVVYTAQPLWSAAFGAAALGERLESQARWRRDRAETTAPPMRYDLGIPRAHYGHAYQRRHALICMSRRPRRHSWGRR